MGEQAIVIAIIAVAAGYLAWRMLAVRNSSKGQSCGCGCSCGSGDKKSCPGAKQ